MDIEEALNREAEVIEKEYNEGRISLEEYNKQIANLEREAREEDICPHCGRR